MAVWTNFIGYQLAWFIAVINAGEGRAWPGAAAALLFTGWQLAVSSRRQLELRLIAVALLLGALIDGGLAVTGFALYSAPFPAIPPGGAPLWILALWIAFSMTLTQSLAWLQKRPLLGLVFGAVGAPLAYLGAARGWGAVRFVPPTWHAVLWLAIGWGAAMLLLIRLIAHWSRAGMGFKEHLAMSHERIER